jgi:hypothetical protein
MKRDIEYTDLGTVELSEELDREIQEKIDQAEKDIKERYRINRVNRETQISLHDDL